MDDDATPDTARAGAGLREARERLGWKLPGVATRLHIREEFLEAIEAGDLNGLPPQAYRTGFLRAYARLLGLDAEEILRRFRAAGALEDTRPPAYDNLATALPDRAVPKSAFVVAGVVVALGIYGLLYHYSLTQRQLADTVPPVPADLAPLVPVAPVAAATTPVVPATATPAPVTTPAATATPTTATPVTPTPTPVATTAPSAGLALAATGDAWVEVHDAGGNILFSKVLHAGESWPVPQEAGLTLTTGNAGNTVLVNNGTPGTPLGTAEQVLHNYQLTPPAPGAAPTPAATPVSPPVTAPAAPAAAAPLPTQGHQ